MAPPTTGTSILEALNDATSVGMTPRQIASKIGYDTQDVTRHLLELKGKGEVAVIGRGLWILSKFREMSHSPEFKGPDWYVSAFNKEYGIAFEKYNGKITFSDNGDKRIHRWSPYVQGFSASFVDTVLNRYRIGKGNRVLDPFVGCGTVLVCARLRGSESIGVDLMPLMAFASRVKTRWDINVEEIQTELERIKGMWKDILRITPPFLKCTHRQFNEEVLTNLLRLKQSIQSVNSPTIRELFQIAFATILVDCSGLKRSPALGYVKNKVVSHPFTRFEEKIKEMVSDLLYVQQKRDDWGPEPRVIEDDAREVKYEPESIDIAVTSPPYVNGMDYVINYKIEMAWLDNLGVKSYADLASLKGKMVACDNLSKRVVQEFAKQSTRFDDEWVTEVVGMIKAKVDQKENYRRNDMHLIVRKYFDDLYHVFENVKEGLKPNGQFVIVIGDSLIAGTYIPADLILARIGKKVGFKIENIEVARRRRSGQRRSFILRESVLTLTKGQPQRYGKLDSFLSRA